MQIKKIFKSIGFAYQGVKYVFLHEQNFRIQSVATAAVIVLSIWLPLTRNEIIIVLLLSFTVLILEIINSAFEQFLDLLKPRMNYHAKIIKDMLAAMVLLAVVFSATVGFVIFAPYLFELVSK